MHIAVLLAATTLSPFTCASPSDVGGETQDQTAPAAAPLPGPDAGQQDTGLAEIVVTAQRRSQNLQDVPIAITAVTGDQMTKSGIRDPRDLVKVEPSLSFQAGTAASTTALFIRGVGIGDFNSNTTGAVGVYVDDVFMGANAGKLFNIFDSDGIEVLKGPQGTLYGRNTTAGAIRFASRKPTDEWQIDAAASYGRFNEVQLEAGVGGPIVKDLLKFRVAGTYTRRDGWDLNRVTGHYLNDLDMWAGRAIADFTPSDNLLIRAIFHGGQNRGGARQFVFLGQGTDFSGNPSFVNGFPADAFGYADTDNNLNAGDYDIEGKEKIDAVGGSLTARWKLGRVTLTSISAYEQVNRRTLEDTDASPDNVITATYIDRPRQFSQELRLASSDAGRFTWVLGGYYFHDKLVTRSSYDVLRLLRDPSQPLGGFDPDDSIGNNYFPYTQRTSSYALFGQGDYHITDRLTATVGLRGSSDRIALDFFSGYLEPAPVGLVPQVVFKGEQTYRDLSYRAALNYKVDHTLLYASYSKGYNSGGYAGGSATTADQLLPYKSERLYAYEVGIKTDVLDRKLRLNSAAFYYKYDDLQVFVFDTSRTIPVQRKLNAGNADIFGLEVTLDARPIPQLDVFAGGTLLHSEFTKFVALAGADYKGNRLIDAPTLSATGGFSFTQPVTSRGKIRLSADVQYTSKVFLTPDNDPLGEVRRHAIANARLAWLPDGDRVEVALWAKNVTNKRVMNFIAPIITSYELNYNDPPTYGIQLVFHSK